MLSNGEGTSIVDISKCSALAGLGYGLIFGPLFLKCPPP